MEITIITVTQIVTIIITETKLTLIKELTKEDKDNRERLIWEVYRIYYLDCREITTKIQSMLPEDSNCPKIS